jgi:hypothetical protein
VPNTPHSSGVLRRPSLNTTPPASAVQLSAAARRGRRYPAGSSRTIQVAARGAPNTTTSTSSARNGDKAWCIRAGAGIRTHPDLATHLPPFFTVLVRPQTLYTPRHHRNSGFELGLVPVETPAMSSPKDTERHEEHHHLSLIRDGRDPTLPSNHPINALSSTRKLAILCVLTYAGFLANFRWVSHHSSRHVVCFADDPPAWPLFKSPSRE